jgi:molybdopterin-containing oxidoreductase family membrane subunit
MIKRIGSFDREEDTPDDLKKLKEAGPVLEQHLHQVGIFTFEQVSKLEPKDFELLEELIPNFPSGENREDWVAQANKLKK